MQNCPLESSRGCMTPSSFKKTVGQTFQDLPLKDLDQSFVGFVFSPKLLKELEPVDQKLETEIKELLTTAPLKPVNGKGKMLAFWGWASQSLSVY